MKSKTSCYEPAIGRMTVRRFGPIWILYILGLLLLTAVTVSGEHEYGSAVSKMSDLPPWFAMYNCAYALILGQLLFGDLYSKRLSFAIHSLPVTRGGWFGTQIILGILSGIIPSLLSAGLMMLYVTRFRIIIFWILCSTLLQFLFFFGAAALCAVCAGNRFGMAVLYGIVNTLGAFWLWLEFKLFAQVMYGIYLSHQSYLFSPVLNMVGGRLYVWTYDETYLYTNFNKADFLASREIESVSLNGTFWTLAIYAALGCAAIWLALKLLHKRKPECVGDLVAFPKLKPIILVICTVCTGVVFHVGAYIFNWSLGYLLLAVGLVLGYYACLMLLKRQINVFTLKSIPPLAAICLVLLAAVTLTGLDVFGIVDRVPQADKIESASLQMSYGGNYDYTVTDPEQIAELLAIHQAAVDDHRAIEQQRPLLQRIFGGEGALAAPSGNPHERTALAVLTYQMKDGSTMQRCYHFCESGGYVQQLKAIFSRPEQVFRIDSRPLSEDGTLDFLSQVPLIELRCFHGTDDEFHGREKLYTVPAEDYDGLMQAILADCEARNAVQVYMLHPGEVRMDQATIYFRTPNGGYTFDLELYPCMTNTHAWFTAHFGHEIPPIEPAQNAGVSPAAAE